MIIDWKNTDVSIAMFGKYRWKRGLANDGTWTGYVTDNHLWVPISGQGQVHTHEGTQPFQKGRVFWFKPGFCYRATQNPARPMHFYAIHFDLLNSHGRVVEQNIPLPPDVIEHIDYRYIQTLFEHILSIGSFALGMSGSIMSENDYRHEKCLHLLKLILIKLDENCTEPENQEIAYDSLESEMAKITYQMQHDPTYRPNVNEIAKQLGVSASSFCHLFKRRYLKSPNQLSIRWRITHASRLLEETTLSVKEIAKLTGYNSLHLFGRQFKKWTEYTPLQYRKHKLARS